MQLYTVHCTLHAVHSTLYTARCTQYTVHCTMHAVHVTDTLTASSVYTESTHTLASCGYILLIKSQW